MKKSALAIFALLCFTMGIHAQNPFSFKLDTTKGPLLGFSKQKRWSLIPDKSIGPKEFDLIAGLDNTANKKGFTSNMPIHRPDSFHSMMVHIPDSTIAYNMPIHEPKNAKKF